MDGELFKQIFLVSGPFGVLAFVFFRRLEQHSTECQTRLIDFSKDMQNRLAEHSAASQTRLSDALSMTRQERAETVAALRENSGVLAELKTLISASIEGRP